MKMHKLLILMGLALVGLSVQAAPTSGAYITDPQSENTADQAMSEMSQPTSILCIISNTRPDAMVNAGTYVALIDEKKCDEESMSSPSNSTSTSNTGATSYLPISLTATRASSTAAQIIKGHADMTTDDGTHVPVYIHMTQSEAGSSSAPNGVLTFNYAMALNTITTLNSVNLPAGAMIVRGRISTSATGIQYAEVGGMGTNQTNDVRLYVTGNDTSGSGAIVADYNSNNDDATYIFGYNSTYFCRSGTEASTAIAEKCFKRSKADAIKSVWRYGVYNADGSRFDLATPSFSVKDAAGEWGYASYWGLWFRTPPADGATVTHAKNGTAYTVKKAGGRLLKTVRYQKTLGEIKNNKFQFGGNIDLGSGVTNGTYEAYWDATSATFKIVGTQSCTNSGCFSSVISPAVSVSAANLLVNNSWGIWGWSQSLGNLSIPSTTLSGQTNTITYMTETLVKPGESVPANLKCVANCPTDARLLALAGAPTTASPYVSTTENSWSGIATPVAYTWDATTYKLKDDTGTEVTADRLSSLSSTALDKTNYKWNIRSGALVDASKFVPGGDMDCDGAGVGTNYCDWKANDLTVYYRFETGIQDWNRATFLMSGSTPVSFTPPMDASYQVPSDTATYGQYAGALMNLQFSGFGDLNGIPGRCVDPYTNTEVSCSSSTRWYPAFPIADGTEITIDGAKKYVKWLDRELRFAPDTGSAASRGITMGSTANLPAAVTSLTTLTCTADAADTTNPCNTSSANYSGAFSLDLFKKSPSVIHGVVQ